MGSFDGDKTGIGRKPPAGCIHRGRVVTGLALAGVTLVVFVLWSGVRPENPDSAGHLSGQEPSIERVFAVKAICGFDDLAPEQDGGLEHHEHMASPDPAHGALLAGMSVMHAQMMAGMRVADIDEAFVCGMIPHHRGAIEMARAQIEFGKDPEIVELSLAIVDAQEREIEGMVAWLENRLTQER